MSLGFWGVIKYGNVIERVTGCLRCDFVRMPSGIEEMMDVDRGLVFGCISF